MDAKLTSMFELNNKYTISSYPFSIASLNAYSLNNTIINVINTTIIQMSLLIFL